MVADTSTMNLETLIDDLEAAFAQLQPKEPKLSDRVPVGFTKVTFGRDHFAGLVTNDESWQLVPFNGCQVIATASGESELTSKTISQACQRLLNLWVRVKTIDQTVQGRLEKVENRLLIFREFCVPIGSVQRIELHAVDNRIDL